MLNFVVDVLLPPTSLVVLALLLLLFGGRRSRLLATVLTAIVVLLSIPVVSGRLLDSLAAPLAPPGEPPAAIVVLSADAVHVAGAADLEPGPLTLERLRAGAALQRRTGLPLLVSGGRIQGSRMSLAAMMTSSLRDDFGLPVRWVEGHSRDTWENAADSAVLLKPAGIRRIYLVTNFWHMRRALIAFRAAGLDPVAAPVRAPYPPPLTVEQFVPRSSAWYGSYLALHEWVGFAYYTLRR